MIINNAQVIVLDKQVRWKDVGYFIILRVTIEFEQFGSNEHNSYMVNLVHPFFLQFIKLLFIDYGSLYFIIHINYYTSHSISVKIEMDNNLQVFIDKKCSNICIWLTYIHIYVCVQKMDYLSTFIDFKFTNITINLMVMHCI